MDAMNRRSVITRGVGAMAAALAAGSAAKPAAQAQATALAAPAAAIRVAGGDKVKISPAARKLAEENGIDRTTLAGTGPEGRIVREDVEKAMAEAAAAANVPVDARPVIEVIPYEGMRQVIGENMVSSYSIAPKVTHMVSVDVSAFGLLRAQINSDLKETEKISVTDLLVKAVAKALERHPRINSTLSGESIKILKEINIGVAVALTEGLIVPVVKDANKKSIYDVSGEIRDFGKRARKNRVAVEEMTGSTFTISNVGGYGSVDWFTPIINQPESAILGVGRTVKMPVVVDDQIAIRPMMGLSLAFDHRVIDGAPAAEFLATLLKLIEKPHKIFI